MRTLVSRGVCAAVVIFPLASSQASSQTAKFVPPPRTAVDIEALLAQDKPTDQRLAKLRAQAAAAPPALGRAELARFHYDRGQARASLGDATGAAADARQAIALGKGGDVVLLGTYRQLLTLQLSQSGEPKKALAELRLSEKEVNRPGSKGHLFSIYYFEVFQNISLGDFDTAQAIVRRSQNLYQEAQQNWDTFAARRTGWAANVDRAKGILFLARGQYREGEAAFAKAEDLMRQWAVVSTRAGSIVPVSQLQQAADVMLSQKGMMKARQGRFAEGEADVRRALINQLQISGRYNLVSAQISGRFGAILLQQGRFKDAEAIFRSTIETLKTIGLPDTSQLLSNTRLNLATSLNLQQRWDEANAVYAALEKSTENWEQARKDAFGLGEAQINAFYTTNNLAAGVPAARRLLERQTARYGAQHQETALARGLYAIGLSREGKVEDARREFALAIPVLIAAIRASANEDRAETAARDQRIQSIVEAYMRLLAGVGGAQAADEAFPLADIVRSQTVQRALVASSLRVGARDPAMAETVRKQQDLDKQVAAQVGALNNALGAPPQERDENGVKMLQAEVKRLTQARDAAATEIAKRFRNFSNLVSPAPASAAEVRQILRPGEAFVSFYFGRDASFVWVVPQTGATGFALIPFGSVELERKTATLRAALEPNAVSVIDIPPFDLDVAYDLYKSLLKPVEANWREAKSLIVATNGSLGLTPLGLLPMEPAQPSNEGPLFSGYRNVEWLARKYAVTAIPSASAFRTLRESAAQTNDARDKLIGFGNPVFKAGEPSAAPSDEPSADQTRGAPFRRRAGVTTRGADAADLAQLPPLPDTADELRAIASALAVDPAKSLHLGIDANERTVETSDLAKYRIVAFATHGLLPGDLDGLTQPALALTAPNVAHVDGDGLLTMEKILGLRLNADWVLLSACNSGAGSSAGAEAASGLGRAFFYAGARALLITNWSVHSASARELVSDVFLRMQAEPGLDRAEALRRAEMRLLDEGGQKDANGNFAFAYAHPLFWAPYTIVGDAGSAR